MTTNKKAKPERWKILLDVPSDLKGRLDTRVEAMDPGVKLGTAIRYFLRFIDQMDDSELFRMFMLGRALEAGKSLQEVTQQFGRLFQSIADASIVDGKSGLAVSLTDKGRDGLKK